jgi:hypothetical protein
MMMGFEFDVSDIVILSAIVLQWFATAFKDKRIDKDELAELVGIVATQVTSGSYEPEKKKGGKK